MSRRSRPLSHLLPVLAGVCLVTATPAHAQAAPSKPSVEVLRPLTFQKRDDLDFGIVVPGAVGGSVQVTPGGVVNLSGDVRVVGTDAHPAQYVTTGGANKIVLIGTQVATLALKRAGGGAPDILVNWGGAPIRAYFRLTQSGVHAFVLGGTITVAGGQPAGDYSGDFQITATYF